MHSLRPTFCPQAHPDVHNRPERQNLCADLIKTADMLSGSLKVPILRCFVMLNSLEAEWEDLVAENHLKQKAYYIEL